MTRINTNVSSLNAQKSLARANTSLQTALTRLSTGLRINYGRDDPAGLIASEALRSDITSTAKAITNSQRANQMIATADSALGQVSSLLNDIRGLVTEAANTGAMSDDQIAANQLQVDSSLSALNRIAQSTSFQGRRLLDGSLDFLSTAGTIDSIDDIRIDQASLGTSGSIAVDVDIATAAAQGTITNADGFTTAANANTTLTFANGATLTTTTNAAVIEITSTDLSDTTAVEVVIVNTELGGASAGVQVASAVLEISGNTLTIHIDLSGGATSTQVQSAINAVSGFEARIVTDADFELADSNTATTGQAQMVVKGAVAGAEYNALEIAFTTQASLGATPTAAYDSTANTLTITVDSAISTTLAAIRTAITGVTNGSFSVTNAIAGDERTFIHGAAVDVDETANMGTTGGGLLADSLTIQIGGADGTEVFAFESGASVNQMAAAINLVTDASGVAASYTGNTLTLISSAYGTDAFVDVNVIEEGASGTFEDNLSATRDAGEDIIATVNGISATGDGNTFSINTATLSMTTTVSDGSDTNFDFNITGGGAMFQLGPDVVTNQQVRMGITSVNTATLRGESGRLYTIASGGDYDLDSDPNTAAKIVDEVIAKVTLLRGRLGAFQKTSLDTNIASLSDTLENLTAAESAIRDADFAAETASLTRAQILVQSGISVLGIANSNPQNVLALLR